MYWKQDLDNNSSQCWFGKRKQKNVEYIPAPTDLIFDDGKQETIVPELPMDKYVDCGIDVSRSGAIIR